MRLALWPNGLVGRVGLVLFAAVVLEVIGGTFVFEQAEVLSGAEVQAWRIADQLHAARRVLAATDPTRRPMVADALSVSDLSLVWMAPGATRIDNDTHPRSHSLLHSVVVAEPELGGHDLRLRMRQTSGGQIFEGDLRLDDGSTLRFDVADLPNIAPSLSAQLGSIAILSACVLLAALLVVRTLAAPLALLVRATDAIGHGPPVRIAVKGPDEVKRVARAFNAMQDRIAKLVRDRTEALAAVSHDLRTPITRMRLRAGFLSSAEDRQAFETDLGEMEAMVNDLLSHLGGESDPEKPRRYDLVAMLTTLVDAASDAGHAARYEGPGRHSLVGRLGGVRRALSNIVNNALAYGGCARVALQVHAAVVTVTISDDGPGIPEAAFDKVFEPFHRLEESRNRGTGGTGLGLTIARNAIARDGGSIALHNRPEGGLTVIVTLPNNQG